MIPCPNFLPGLGRALHPYSKLYCHQQWLKEEVFLPEGQDLALHQLYRAMDHLLSHQEAVEKAVYFKMADLMNADVCCRAPSLMLA